MSSSRDRVQKACEAAKALGIATSTTKPVLKRLLRVYENNWEYIEADNYQVLVDAIFDTEEAQDGVTGDQPIVDDVGAKKNDVEGSGNCHSYGIRVRDRQDEQHMLRPELSRETSLKRPKLEQEDILHVQHQQKMNDLALISRNTGSMTKPAEPQRYFRGKAPCQPLAINKAIGSHPFDRVDEVSTYVNHASSSSILNIQPLQAELSGLVMRRKGKEAIAEASGNSFIVKEPIVDVYYANNTCLDVWRSWHNLIYADHECMNQGDMLKVSSTHKANEDSSPGLLCKSTMDGEGSLQDDAYKRKTSRIIADRELPSIVDVASSKSGEIKLSFSYSCPDKAGFHVSDIEEVFKRVENKCFKSYKILQPSFSIGNITRELCQSFLELSAESPEDKQETSFGGIPAFYGDLSQPTGPERSGIIIRNGSSSSQKAYENSINRKTKKNKEPDIIEYSKSMSGNMVVVQKPQLTLVEPKPIHDVNDISKGEERVKISIANDITDEKYPPFFNYIPHNIVYQNAYINVSLARIGDDDYCEDCYNDCLAALIPCACARETGGVFAYTCGGIMKKELLNEYMSMNYETQKDWLFYCKECPLERSNNEAAPEACKGHMIRKFVKECWSKCGCSKQCGNRVVQRGIKYNLQVFYTPEGKGWGLRTLDELPRGAFVCEYVGEVLTNTELYDRTIQATGRPRHTYPVLLDADWGSEGSLKDEEALCLDATFYGNVARFINHRCSDANLIGIPVEVETPDRHYYHLAFFATRKVEPLEELTWDYGIDFDDHGHPIKAFKCHCGSQVCRDTKHVKRSRKKLR